MSSFGVKTTKDAILFLTSVVFCGVISFSLISGFKALGYVSPWNTSVLSFIMVGIAIFVIFLNIPWATFAISSLFYNFPKVEGNVSSPLVSLLIPACNEEKVISGIVSDLLRQTYKNIEVIVVAHNCDDKTAEVLEQIGDHRLKIFELATEEAGKSFPLNFAVRQASGEIVGQFDADNRIKDVQLIENAVRYFLDSSIDAIQGRLEAKNHKVNLLTKYQFVELKVWEFIFCAGKNRLMRPAHLLGTNAFFRREILEKVNYWDRELVEDLTLYLKLSSIKAKIVYAHDVVSFDEKPVTWSGAFKQRKRWVRGDMNLIPKWLFKKISVFDKMYLLLPIWLPLWYGTTIISTVSALFSVVFWQLPNFVWIGQLLLQYILLYGILKKMGVSRLKYMPLFYIFSFHAFILIFFVLRNVEWKSTKTIHGGAAPMKQGQDNRRSELQRPPAVQ